MPSPRFTFRLFAVSLLGLWTVVAAVPQVGTAIGGGPAAGKWAGDLSSRNYASFPATLTITQDATGTLRGAAVLSSPCVREGVLVVRINGSNISLAGSDREGDNITFRGAIDSTGKQMTLSYIVNGSASGRCETDQGSGTLTKQ